MGSISLHLLSIFAIAAVLFICASGYQIALDELNFASDVDYEQDIVRAKRQAETFDYPTTANENQQEEGPGFWEKMVNVAIRLFSRFIEWINSVD